MEIATLILQTIAALLAIGAFIYIIRAARDTKKTMHFAKEQLEETISTRQYAIISQKMLEWDSLEMDKAKMLIYEGNPAGPMTKQYWLYLNRYQKGSVLSILRFFDSLDVLIKLGALNADLVLKYFGEEALYYWEVFYNAVIELEREKRGWIFTGCENLVRLATDAGMKARSKGFWKLGD